MSFADLNSSSQQHVLDLVAIYRALLDHEENESNTINNINSNVSTINNTSVEDSVINDTKDNKGSSGELPDLVIDALSSTADKPVEAELDIAATCVAVNDAAEVVSGSCCLDTLEPGQLPDLIPQQPESCSSLTSSIPDLLPAEEHHRAAAPPPRLEAQRRFRIRESVRELTEKREERRRKRREEERMDEEARTRELWQHTGRQLGTISATFFQHLRREEDQWNDESEESALASPRLGPAKFMTDLALSVVTNAVIYVCIKKLKRLIF